jgi:pheromone shutdown protein TraB
VREQQASRVLVIVGAGHKYFLDKLARDDDYRWIDPREYLPPDSTEPTR